LERLNNIGCHSSLIVVGKPEGRRPLGRPRLDGRIILKLISKKWDGEAWTGLSRLRIGTGGGLL
jgi:hypothetical protein